MPEIELLSPLRLNLKGVLYKKGEKLTVDARTALWLSKNPRFKVTGLGSAEIAEAQAAGPSDEEKADLIREAIDDLDPDTEGAFDEGTGKPAIRHLSKVLGFEVSADDLGRAMKVDRVAPQAADTAGLIDTASIKAAAAERRGFKVAGKRAPPAPPAETAETV